MTEIVREDYRDAMARLGAAVSIVTTDGPAGRAGFTASAACSVTDDPPTLLVCMNRASSAYVSVVGNNVVLRQ
ncbi:flavin reductase (DIM6/NTAB) family NADH-FMN oxidoreductase RutF [Bradyrhizobium sp. F1.4.3]